MPAANPIKNCPGCTDRAVRATLLFAQQCSPCRKKERHRLWCEANPDANARNAKHWRDAGNKGARTEESKERERQRSRERYHVDPAVRAAIKASNERRRRETPEAVAAYNKQWRENNLEHSRKYQRDRARDYGRTEEGKEKQRLMRLRFRDARQARNAGYNARRYGEHGALEGQFIYQLHKWQDHCCIYCNQYMYGRETIEHIAPLKFRGNNLPHNTALACLRCNGSKQDVTLDKWRPETAAPVSRYHSTHGLTVAAKSLRDRGIIAELTENHLTLPTGLKLFVLSSFWLAERLESAPIDLRTLVLLSPGALFTFDFEWRLKPAEITAAVLEGQTGDVLGIGRGVATHAYVNATGIYAAEVILSEESKRHFDLYDARWSTEKLLRVNGLWRIALPH